MNPVKMTILAPVTSARPVNVRAGSTGTGLLGPTNGVVPAEMVSVGEFTTADACAVSWEGDAHPGATLHRRTSRAPPVR